MDKWLLDLLRCPFCGGHLNAAEPNPVTNGQGYGILTCYCGRYPVVAGIPVLKRDSPRHIDNVITLIEAGQHEKALLTLLAPSASTLTPAWARSLPTIKGLRWLRYRGQQLALRKWYTRAVGPLVRQRNQMTACDLFAFYFHNKKDSYDYFAFRPGQPRHLVSLAYTSLIHQPPKPILDFACGCGHVTYSLGHRAGNQPVIGVDDFFFGLYVAKYWIAPQAHYICCTADSALPFPDAAFSAVFCSDAFHYFANKVATFREFKRVIEPQGLIMMMWIHNALWRCPHDGLPLPPEGYEALVRDMPHRLVADTDVLMRYLQKQGPPLARSAEPAALARAPLLSIVASHNQEIFQDHGVFTDWPHAKGRLGLNPLYVAEEQNSHGEDVHLRRMFPSAFYENEHGQCKIYLPERTKMQATLIDHLTQGRRSPELEHLIDQCVILAMPDRYRRSPYGLNVKFGGLR
jgi:ubiquinone/menaquinone biosynthesis C-methylase UbiE/uncharacterized protein YbaR (Trm112 family)